MNTLAINGGTPAIGSHLPKPFPGGYRFGSDEEQAAIEVLRARSASRFGDGTGGLSRSQQLEVAFAKHVGAKHCVAVSSGTAALQCAMAAAGVGPGDEVIVPAYTWISTAAAALFAGALPVVAEIDASLTLDPADVERKITARTRAIVAVHMRGGASRMRELKALAQQHGIALIEDSAQALGGSYGGQTLGTIGDIGAYSLQFSKIITAGEGGLVATNDTGLWQRIMMFHDVTGGLQLDLPPEQLLPGLGLRLSELHSAIALAQLGKLDGILADLRRNRAVLKASVLETLAQKGLSMREEPDPAGDAGVCLVIYAAHAEQASWAASAMRAEGAHAFQIYAGRRDYHVYCEWTPLVNQRSWARDNAPWSQHGAAQTLSKDACPRSIDLLSRAVHIDISPDLDSAQIEELADAVNKVFSAL